MSIVDVEKAVDFIHQNGNPVTMAFARYGIDKINPEQMGEEDAYGISLLTPTLSWCQWLIWMQPVGNKMLLKTTDYLKSTQKQDGYWDEPDELSTHDVAPWMVPGQFTNQVWFTAAVCCKLKELNQTDEIHFETALEFLRSGWDGTRFPYHPHTHWHSMALMSMVEHGSTFDEQIMIGCNVFLQHGIKQGEIDPLDVITVAHSSHLCGDFGADLLALCLDKISSYQQADGGLVTFYGESARSTATANALLLLRYIDRLG